MSVTSLLEDSDVCAQIDRVVPPFPPRIIAPLRAPPVTRSYALVGTAFDYALRFELQRRYPHVRTEPWVAEAALGRFSLYSTDDRLRRVAEDIVVAARTEMEIYRRTDLPTQEQCHAMAEHAIRLAKLDAVYRAGYVDTKMNVAEPGDVQDLLQLLDIVPFTELAHSGTLWLNPTFGRYSSLVGGADCDLVSGDCLIDIKVTKSEIIRQDYMRQLVSYAILGRGVRTDDPAWPEVRFFGIYFARHGHLWIMPADTVFANPAYAEVEAWYFERAAEEFGASLAELAPRSMKPSVTLNVGEPTNKPTATAKSDPKKTRKRRPR